MGTKEVAATKSFCDLKTKNIHNLVLAPTLVKQKNNLSNRLDIHNGNLAKQRELKKKLRWTINLHIVNFSPSAKQQFVWLTPNKSQPRIYPTEDYQDHSHFKHPFFAARLILKGKLWSTKMCREDTGQILFAFPRLWSTFQGHGFKIFLTL